MRRPHLPDGHDDGDDGRHEAPHNGHNDPPGEVALCKQSAASAQYGAHAVLLRQARMAAGFATGQRKARLGEDAGRQGEQGPDGDEDEGKDDAPLVHHLTMSTHRLAGSGLTRMHQ